MTETLVCAPYRDGIQFCIRIIVVVDLVKIMSNIGHVWPLLRISFPTHVAEAPDVVPIRCLSGRAVEDRTSGQSPARNGRHDSHVILDILIWDVSSQHFLSNHIKSIIKFISTKTFYLRRPSSRMTKHQTSHLVVRVPCPLLVIDVLWRAIVLFL